MIHLLGVALAFFCIYEANTQQLTVPLAQWVTVAPAVVIGLFLKGPMPKRVVLTGGGGVVTTGIMTFGFGWDSGAWQTLVAITVFATASEFAVLSNAVSAKLSGVSFGIYLIHPAVYWLVRHILTPGTLLTYVVVVVVSAGLTLLLRRVSPFIV